MSFPLKPSTSKSGRLTRQDNVVSHACGHSRGSSTSSPIQDSFLHTLNPRSTLLLHAELPKPMSRLPEIRLEGGAAGNGSKGQIAQMKPQKSCESYDSTVSGMSWSSSQSTVAIGGGTGFVNSASVSRNLSIASYEEDDDQPHKPITRIPSTPGGMQKSQYSLKGDGELQQTKQMFRTGHSFEEEQEGVTFKDQEAQNSPNDQAEAFLESVFEENKTEVVEVPESEPATRGSAKRSSLKNFWKMAYKAIINDSTGKEGNSKLGSKKKAEDEKPEEIDPVYQLLKSAASQGRITPRTSTSLDLSNELIRPSPRLSTSSRKSSTSQKERSHPL
ncbi:hypothetical protein Aperf_G00000096757 [Anoplocephala perfoliata]